MLLTVSFAAYWLSASSSFASALSFIIGYINTLPHEFEVLCTDTQVHCDIHKARWFGGGPQILATVNNTQAAFWKKKKSRFSASQWHSHG